jgi:hypothetical protein
MLKKTSTFKMAYSQTLKHWTPVWISKDKFSYSFVKRWILDIEVYL